MRRSQLATLTALLVLLLSGCGGGATIGKTAVREGGKATQSGLKVIELSAGEVTTLAERSGVSDDVIRDVAPKLEQQRVWQRSITEVKTAYEQTPEEVRSNLIGIACEGSTGQISSDAELAQKVQERFRDATQEDVIALANAVLGLWQGLNEASASADPEARAAAVLTCFTIEQLAG